MRHAVKYSIVSIISVVLLIPFFYGAAAEPRRIKSALSDTVYFLDTDDVRHPFPNRATYLTWYEDFNDIITVDQEILATYPLGDNIPIRSGNIVKVPSSPTVYAVEPGGVLRAIDNEDIMVLFYGVDWAKRIIDIPEVFFVNYSIGKPIRTTSDVPNGILYKLPQEETLYWKDRDILTRFSDISTVVANKLRLDSLVEVARTYFTRNHVIDKVEPALFTPSASASESTADCNAEKLQANIIFLHEGEVRNEDLLNIESVKRSFPAYWHSQSRTFSSLSFPLPTQLIDVDMDNRIVNDDGRFEVTHEIGFDYYSTLPDTVDFLIIFTDFPVGEGTEAFFSPVTQSIQGIGKQRLDRSAIFGSGGKLKGVVVMGSIDNFSFHDQRQRDSVYNTIAHELLHNWSGSLYFMDDQGVIQSDLLAEDKKHWTPWASFTSPLGGKGWHATANNTFSIDTDSLNTLARSFHDLDLYAMGLLPPQLLPTVGYIDSSEAEPSSQSTSNHMITVQPEQILDANGIRTCVLPGR